MPVIAAQPYDYSFPAGNAGADRDRHATRLRRGRRLRIGAGQRRASAGQGHRAHRAPPDRRLPRRPACRSSIPGRATSPICSDCPPAKRVARPRHADHRRRRARWAASWSTANPATTIVPELAAVAGRDGDRQARQGRLLRDAARRHPAGDCGIGHLVFAGVTTEVCVQTTMREANDRGYECLLAEDATESYFPEFKAATLAMIRAQGGIVGWTAPTDAVVKALR